MLYLLADQHWGHRKILEYQPCRYEGFGLAPDATIEDHNQAIDRNWVSVVQPSDAVLCLGDVAFGHYDVRHLPGYKILIKGNHDGSTRALLNDGWDEVYRWQDYLAKFEPHEIDLPCCGAKDVLLTHGPVPVEWLNSNNFDYNFHGHLHSHAVPSPRHFCVSMEQIGYKPITEEAVIERVLANHVCKPVSVPRY